MLVGSLVVHEFDYTVKPGNSGEVMQNASRAQARDRVKVAARCTSASV